MPKTTAELENEVKYRDLLIRKMLGETKPITLPRGTQTLAKDAAVSPRALALASDVLTKLAAEVYRALQSELKGVEAVVFADPPADLNGFWNWLHFVQRTATLEKRVNELGGGLQIMDFTVPTVLAGLTAMDSFVGLARVDTTEFMADPGLDTALFRNAVLATHDASTSWKVYLSAMHLAGSEYTPVQTLEIAGVQRKLAALAERMAANEAPAAAVLKKEVQELRDEFSAQLLAGGYAALVREELLARALYGADIATAAGSLGQIAAASKKVRFVRLALERQAQARVERKFPFFARYHFEATLIASYTIHSVAGEQLKSAVQTQSFTGK